MRAVMARGFDNGLGLPATPVTVNIKDTLVPSMCV